MKELTLAATVENIGAVTDFVNEQLEALDCPIKARMQIDIAIDELFGNIAHYAYHPKIGDATVRVEVIQEPLSVVITLIDQGIPFDPLKNEDPDTGLSAEERDIGGLGIFMVKKVWMNYPMCTRMEKTSCLSESNCNALSDALL